MNDMEKVQSTLKQIVRDWSKDGEEERTACYGPIIQEIEINFPPDERYSYYLFNTHFLGQFYSVIICKPIDHLNKFKF